MNSARRVLFVDDEPLLVVGLQRLMRPHRESWDVSIATSAHEALALMEKQSFDVVVSDMRMPVMDGAAFLGEARTRYPATMRIILSGQTGSEAAVRALPVAHQFLSKPTDKALLLQTMQRVTRMQTEIPDPEVHAAIGGIDTLPCLPAIYAELTERLSGRGAPLDAIAALVEREPALVAKILQVVSSPFFGTGPRVARVADAIAHLGTEQLKNLILALAIGSSLPVRAAHFDAAAFHDHSMAVALVARQVAPVGSLADASFAAALLHDIGKLAMASTLPDQYDRIAAKAADARITFEQAETELGEYGTAKLGACLVDLWGIPGDVVEAILHHHDASTLPAADLRSLDIVHIAHRIVENPTESFTSAEDRAYLSRLGLLEKVQSITTIHQG